VCTKEETGDYTALMIVQIVVVVVVEKSKQRTHFGMNDCR
jgi:hypothetical protein